MVRTKSKATSWSWYTNYYVIFKSDIRVLIFIFCRLMGIIVLFLVKTCCDGPYGVIYLFILTNSGVLVINFSS